MNRVFQSEQLSLVLHLVRSLVQAIALVVLMVSRWIR